MMHCIKLQNPFVELQNEIAKLKHRVQAAEEERDIAVEKERDTKLRVRFSISMRISVFFKD